MQLKVEISVLMKWFGLVSELIGTDAVFEEEIWRALVMAGCDQILALKTLRWGRLMGRICNDAAEPSRLRICSSSASINRT